MGAAARCVLKQVRTASAAIAIRAPSARAAGIRAPAERLRRGATMAALLVLTALVVSPAAGASASPQPSGGAHIQPPGTRSFRPVCGRATAGHARCFADVVTVSGAPGAAPLASSTPSGYGPPKMQSAYKLSVASASSGSTQTVAIVDAFDDPTAESDLATYRAKYGLPPCTTVNGCFSKVDQRGGASYPTPNPGWSSEIALDTDMVSAICPNCKIVLVEADNNAYGNLGAAVDEAAALGATQITNSYGSAEFPSERNLDIYYDHPGIAVTVSSGDFGYGAQYPAASPYVTAVGGTSLTPDLSTSRGWTETGWAGAGSGCSLYEPKSLWQTDLSCSNRTVTDVSALADPATGVAVYSTSDGGWVVYGGTSASSPIVAAYDALIGPAAASPQYHYANPGSYFDVTSGSNGFCGGSYLCTSGPGYDGPTGIGTPDGANLAACAAPPTVTTGPANQTVTAPAGASFTAAATNTDPNCHQLAIQWQDSTDSGSTFTDLTGETSATLNISPTSTSQSENEYRAVFTNELGPANTTAATLVVLGQPPDVSADASASVTSTSATLTGAVSPNGSSTGYYFQYGTTSSYGSQTPGGSTVGDWATHSVIAPLSSLSGATSYHFRLIASNEYGTQYGGDHLLTTLPALTAPPVPTPPALTLPTSPTPQTPPSPTSSPHVTGASLSGSRLTVSTGAWTGSPDAYDYAWFDCPNAAGGCSEEVTSNETYITHAADMNGQVYAEVRAHNSGGWSGFARSDNQITPAAVTVGRIRVAGTIAAVPLSCRGAAGARCQIMLRLAVTETVRGRKLLGVSAARRPKATKKLVLLASATVTLRGGRTRTVRVTLGAGSKRLLARLHKLNAKLTVTQSGSVVVAKTVSFKAKR